MNIEKLREEIDLIDDKIISLLDKRFEKTDAIGKIKASLDMDVLDNKREEEIVKKIKEISSNNNDILEIYKEIINCSKKRQK